MTEENFFTWKNYKFYTSVNEKTPKNRIIVSLSNGKTVFEDNTYGELHFWRRLQEYIRHTDIKITKVRYQIGRYMIDIPDHAKYYFFIKRQYGEMYSKLNESIKIGCSIDGKTVSGSEYGIDGTRQFTMDIGKCSIGLIKNEK